MSPSARLAREIGRRKEARSLIGFRQIFVGASLGARPVAFLPQEINRNRSRHTILIERSTSMGHAPLHRWIALEHAGPLDFGRLKMKHVAKRRVIIIVHPNNDTKEAIDFRHPELPGKSSTLHSPLTYKVPHITDET